jgi:hypothetical protein
MLPRNLQNKKTHGGRRCLAGRSTIDLDFSKEKILDLYCQGRTAGEIAVQVDSTESTVKRRLTQWGMRKRAPRSLRTDPYLRAQVAMMFMAGFTDEETSLALNADRAGVECVHKRMVERIRKSQGIVRRMTAFARQEANKKLWDVVQAELDSGVIEGYGKGLLYTHFKNLGCQISRYNFIILRCLFYLKS